MSRSPATSDRHFDAVAMEVFSNRLLTITETLAISMMRASFSPWIKERRDFSVGIFDAFGRLVAQGEHIPIHLGSLMGSVEAVVERYKSDGIREGDAYICNDTYVAGGTHLPDIAIVTPVFVDGTLVAFVANIGHHSDVGGPTPGSTSAKARNIFEEGLRLPVMKIQRRGEIDEDILNLVALNSRVPDERRLDLKVQVATNEKGVVATQALVRRMGIAAFAGAIEDVFDYTERRTRHLIDALPEGRHSFSTWMDDDGGDGGGEVRLVATVYREQGRLVIDFEGSAPEARGGLNVSHSALRATVYYCVKGLLDHDLMANSGMARAIEIRAPAGSITNPRHPAACSARTITCQRLAGAIFGAFRPLLPLEKRMSSGNDTLTSISFSGRNPSNGKLYVGGESMGGGGGARFDSDGMDGIHVHTTNSMNLPSELFEHEFPLEIEEYALVSDSGGAGEFRGGLGIARQVRALCEGTVFSARSDSHKRGAAGAEGGADGGLGRIVLNPGRPTQKVLGSRVSGLVMNEGDSIRIETPGGAGFGPPEKRDPQLSGRDDRDGIKPARTETAATKR